MRSTSAPALAIELEALRVENARLAKRVKTLEAALKRATERLSDDTNPPRPAPGVAQPHT